MTLFLDNPRLFNHELFNPKYRSGFEEFMVETSGVEKFGVEVWV